MPGTTVNYGFRIPLLDGSDYQAPDDIRVPITSIDTALKTTNDAALAVPVNWLPTPNTNWGGAAPALANQLGKYSRGPDKWIKAHASYSITAIGAPGGLGLVIPLPVNAAASYGLGGNVSPVGTCNLRNSTGVYLSGMLYLTTVGLAAIWLPAYAATTSNLITYLCNNPAPVAGDIWAFTLNYEGV